MTTLTRLPDDAWADEQVHQALSILSARRAHEWESLRSEREANVRPRIKEWLSHAGKCEERASVYLSEAARFPAAHKDRAYYMRLANDQLAKAADARRSAAILEDSI